MRIEIEKILRLTKYTFDALEEADRKLLQAATETLSNAYAPYSNFKVAAAIQLNNNAIVCGTNQENAAYPSGLCAERVAIFSAKSQYPKAKVLAIAITTEKNFENPVAPCGACRQVLSEFEIQQLYPMRIIFGNPAGEIWISESVENILPLPFQLFGK